MGTVHPLLIHVSELTAASCDLSDMMHRRDLLRCGLAAATLVPAPLRAERERDHDRARQAVERGEALPLFDILARVRSDLGGEVVGVSFERREERWVYEFKVVMAGGGLAEVYVDAASAQILKRGER